MPWTLFKRRDEFASLADLNENKNEHISVFDLESIIHRMKRHSMLSSDCNASSTSKHQE